MVRKAVMDDFPVILNIYATFRAFMSKTGNPTQWADGHPSADLLRECILAQKLFVFTDPDDFSQIRGCFLFCHLKRSDLCTDLRGQLVIRCPLRRDPHGRK